MRVINRIPLIPYSWQIYCLERIKRFNVIVAPRQHGKTELMVEIIAMVAYNPKITNPVINLSSDTKKNLFKIYKSRMDAAFGGHADYKWSNADASSIILKREQGDLITINLYGAVMNPTGPTGTAAHLNIIDEAAKVSEAFISESAIPATTKTQGITIVTGTVEGNFYYDFYLKGRRKMLNGSKNWFTFYMKIDDEWSKAALSEEAREEIRDGYDMSLHKDKLKFQKEFECNWLAGIDGTPFSSYYMKAMDEGRIGEFPFDPNYKLGTAWDDGRGVTAVWFWQFVKGRFNFVHYKEWYESSLPEICYDIKKFYTDLGAEMGFHVLPHTTAEKSYSTRKPISRRKIIWNEFDGRGFYVPMKRVSQIETKLNAGKEFFHLCNFNESGAFDGIRTLQLYSREYNKKLGTFTDKISRSKYSHGGDAFCEIAVAHKLGRLDARIFTPAAPMYGPSAYKLTRPY